MPAIPVIPSPRFPKQQLLKILNAIAGVPVAWQTYRRGMLVPRPGMANAWLLASVQSYQGIGVDELRLIFDPTRNQNDALMLGQRKFTLVLRAQSIDSNNEAFDILERVRFRLRTQTARVLMVPTICLRDFGAMVDLPESTYDIGGGATRQLLEATLDVRMGCVVSADPLDPEEGNWIETASVEPAVVAVPPVGSPPNGNLIP